MRVCARHGVCPCVAWQLSPWLSRAAAYKASGPMPMLMLCSALLMLCYAMLCYANAHEPCVVKRVPCFTLLRREVAKGSPRGWRKAALLAGSSRKEPCLRPPWVAWCRGGPDCSLLFCTNGVLLRMLTAGGEDPLAEVTHLVS